MKSFAKTSLLFALIIAGRYLQPTASAPLATLPSAEPTPAITRYVAPTKPVSASQRQTSRVSHSYFL